MQSRPFRIADITAAPGRIGICRLPGRTGDLAGDLALIEAFAPSFVLSLTEADETAAHGGEGLGAALQQAGIAHQHFPIADFGTPASGDALWPLLTRDLHARLDAGHSVLVHCLGGQGRSGMVALRLLCERGIAPAEALARIRAAEPAAVETSAQEAWGRAGSRRPAKPKPD